MSRWVVAAVAATALAAACQGSGGSAPAAPAGAQGPMLHVVVDTDLAYDDVMALLYLLGRDDVAVDAVTVVGTGEVHCEPGVSNALSLLALGGSPDTPVACGRETPLLGSNTFPDEWRAGADDLSVMELPDPIGEADPRDAVQLLLDEMDGATTLLTLGPLTNVAEALRADPDLASRIPQFVAMAGAIDVDGNAPNGVAEFNVWVDPLAAKEAFDGIPVTLVPLDATNDVRATPFFLETLERHRGSAASEAVYRLMKDNEIIFEDPQYSFWDTVTAVLLLHPELAAWDEARVLITASEDAGAGWVDRWEDGVDVRFATAIPDPLAFEREYLSVLTGVEVTDVRPETTLTITFDGERCSVDPPTAPAGDHVVAFEDRAGRSAGAVLVGFTTGSHEELAAWLGPPGSPIVDRSQPEGIELIAFLDEGGIQPGRLSPGTAAAVCILEDGRSEQRAWLSAPIEVEG